MHELSLAEEVIRIAVYEAGRNNSGLVSEITVEAGIFSGVEIEAFRSAFEIAAADTVVSGASMKIIINKGHGYCNICKKEFEMDNRIDTCPVCGSFPSEIRRGYEFRVLSLVVEKDDEEL